MKKISLLFLFIFALFSFTLFFSPNQAFAGVDCKEGSPLCITPVNTSGKICNPALAATVGCGEGENVIANILAAVIKGFFIIGSIAVLIFLFLGGLTWITAGGQKQNLENAQGKITGAIIGIVIIAGTYAIMYLLGQFLGIDFFKSLVISWPTITP